MSFFVSAEAIYISLELMAIACYVLTGFFKRDRQSNEAAMRQDTRSGGARSARE